ncbi:uncharacterized protein LACBIDRAFT_328021 [Laccaria bicolor S238N-H82]|uniref:Predicted protein n=1 Tax=Laccaria bicolor (strain S238N-H82 / ATCC MYA-4686) TaxID=486041 RepID=B0DE75_LACBS|nr:uncharacterized protein LACBIDRAFT_328021 [Laccaria bicolor S238N-H82]EDR07216.1 predicted protein [Laccaria bicolor S238N-H82]|eukprot:XP_001882147.1 predicted protein [Laccaria bicolor S238N-H82]
MAQILNTTWLVSASYVQETAGSWDKRTPLAGSRFCDAGLATQSQRQRNSHWVAWYMGLKLRFWCGFRWVGGGNDAARRSPSWHLTQYTKHLSRILIPLIMAVAVYIYTISNWGNPKILGRLVWSMLVEVLFNVGMISVSTDRTDRPVGGWVFGTGFHGVPRSKVNLYYGTFQSSSSDSLRSFLAMRIWRSQVVVGFTHSWGICVITAMRGAQHFWRATGVRERANVA